MSKRCFVLLIGCCLCSVLIGGCAAGPVIQLPKPMPDIVATYKSVLVYADRPGMQNSGVQVKKGDHITLMAKGEVDLAPHMVGYVFGPSSKLFYRIGETGYRLPYYSGAYGYTVGEGGNIYLGISEGRMTDKGEPLEPDFYRNNRGSFIVDIIVWKENDPVRIAEFLEAISRKDPQNKELKKYTENFKYLRERALAAKEENKDVGDTKKAPTVMKTEQVQEEKEKKVSASNEKTPIEVKEVEKSIIGDDGKTKVSITTKPMKPKDTTPPKIAIISPEAKRGVKISSKTSKIKIVGRATDESGVAEVTVNGEVVELDEVGTFSSDLLLKIGENEIQVTAMDIHKNEATQTMKVFREALKTSPPQATPVLDVKGKNYALVIGNNDYKYIQKLEIAKKDAMEVEKALREHFGFETRLLLDASRMAILNAINDLRKRLKEEDSLLIYYAGHGDYDRVADKAYWLPVDAEKDNPTNWIMSDDITTNIKRMAPRHVLIVSDSCYSGTFMRSAVTDLSLKSDRDGFIKRMLNKTSRTLMSSGGNEPVSDSGGSGHSVFAESFLKGLHEMGEKFFTADELFYGVIRERVIGKAEQTPQYNNIRNSGHEGGDFVFIKK